MKVTVLGTGSWGTALAKVLCDNEHNVCLWGRDESYIREIRKSRCNNRYLKKFTLPEKLQLSANLIESVQGCDFIINAIPVQYSRDLFEKLRGLGIKVPPIVNCSKGLELTSLKRVSEVVSEIFGEAHNFAVLSGPSHAEEVMNNLPTSVAVASKNIDFAQVVQKTFMNKLVRIYRLTDVIGVEVGGALKNIFAIAAGAIDGIGMGDNTKAALMTRGIAEMTRIGVFFGGKSETFSGLSGIGDLFVTCISQFSRNRFVGECLGKGMKIEQIQQEMGCSVAEGITTVKGVYQLIKKYNLEAPIIEQSYKVIYCQSNVKDALTSLMVREAKKES